MNDDLTVIERVLQGEEEAYSQIVDKYKHKIYAFLLRMINEPQDAQELAQEVFIKAFFHLNQYSPSCNFSAWLYRIAYNHCLDELRRRKKRRWISLLQAPLTVQQTPETIYLAKEQVNELSKVISTLPEDYRTVIFLRYTEQLTFQEISEVLEISVNTVRVRLHRAQKKLRERLKSIEKGGALYDA